MVYRRFDLEGSDELKLAELLEALEVAGYSGVNITHPFKQAILPLLEALSPEASMIGAVNTVRFSNGKRIGYNTDCWGFRENLRLSLAEPAIVTVALIGAGGAGSAAAFGLLEAGAVELLIADHDSNRASALRENLIRLYPNRRIVAVTTSTDAISIADGVVNATPVGMDGHPGLPFDPTKLRSAQWVADVVYIPVETDLIKAARETGCPTVTGLGMAILQAAKAFEIFTQTPANPIRMARALSETDGCSVAWLSDGRTKQ
jgi:shikimate dehydrogenase